MNKNNDRNILRKHIDIKSIYKYSDGKILVEKKRTIGIAKDWSSLLAKDDQAQSKWSAEELHWTNVFDTYFYQRLDRDYIRTTLFAPTSS